VLCNSEIKFRAFLDHALALGADYIATGHYARVETHAGSARLLRGRDPAKDQSYFLYRLQQNQLQRALFPVGHLRKSEVRSLARAHGIGVHAKRDSTGICFIGERPFREFLARYLASTAGDICTPQGDVVGRHVGLVHYTIGQRQGLGIGGLAGRAGAPWYVARKDLPTNRLIVVQGHDHPLLCARGLRAIRQSWISGAAPDPHGAYTAKTRYRQADSPCRIVALDAQHCDLRFDAPQRAITPGQSVVLYDGEICLGGGIIDATIDLGPELTDASLTALAPAE
jgi:tRNA-specific 2-thiouridylase